MTHDELRGLIASYAAATLVEPAAEAVRSHLATGCPECLNELYGLPVGLPRSRPVPVAPRSPSPVPPAVTAATAAPRPTVGASAPGWFLALCVTALAGALGAALLWTAGQLRGHEAEIRRLKVSARQAVVERTALAERLEVAERDLASARASAVEQPPEVAATTLARLGELERELAAARERVALLGHDLTRRDASIARLNAATEESRALRDLLGTPGTRLVRLDPQPPFREPHGHVLCNPARTEVVLHAFDLPRLPRGVSYRLRLTTDGQDSAGGRTLRRGAGGEIALTVHLESAGARLRRVEIVRDPPGTPVLLGWALPAAG